jgi:hypothetical protein
MIWNRPEPPGREHVVSNRTTAPTRASKTKRQSDVSNQVHSSYIITWRSRRGPFLALLGAWSFFAAYGRSRCQDALLRCPQKARGLTATRRYAISFPPGWFIPTQGEPCNYPRRGLEFSFSESSQAQRPAWRCSSVHLAAIPAACSDHRSCQTGANVRTELHSGHSSSIPADGGPGVVLCSSARAEAPLGSYSAFPSELLVREVGIERTQST